MFDSRIALFDARNKSMSCFNVRTQNPKQSRMRTPRDWRYTKVINHRYTLLLKGRHLKHKAKRTTKSTIKDKSKLALRRTRRPQNIYEQLQVVKPHC